MLQKSILQELNINLPMNLGVRGTSYYRLNKSLFCPKVHTHIKKCNRELISQLHSLINENDINVTLLYRSGLFHTIKSNCLEYRISTVCFENKILKHESIKNTVIHNMLYAINLIDHNILQ